MNPLRALLREIHRRSLWQVLLVYAAASWAVIEAIQGLTEATGLPEWFPAFAVGLLLVGFPIVLGTAFVQHGIRRREQIGEALEKPLGREIDGAPIPTPHSAAERIERLFTWRNAVLGGLVAFAIWGLIAALWLFVLGRPGPEPETGPVGMDASVADTTAPVTTAVLPFVNISDDPSNEYFSDGVNST